ncbi:hypothetical protein K1719_010673 [Acacia pycnantha]|nr:hypothetical protein K1719_010673 [Acacia pycnantha]
MVIVFLVNWILCNSVMAVIQVYLERKFCFRLHKIGITDDSVMDASLVSGVTLELFVSVLMYETLSRQ